MLSIFNPAVQERLLPCCPCSYREAKVERRLKAMKQIEKCLGGSFFKITKLTNSCFFYKWWQDTVVQWQSTWPLLTWDSVWYKDKEFLDFLTSFPDICLEMRLVTWLYLWPDRKLLFLTNLSKLDFKRVDNELKLFPKWPPLCKYFKKTIFQVHFENIH